MVLGYINNKTRRLYVYVSNRVDCLHRTSRPEQWSYISTELNPADSGTRCLHAANVQESTWLIGPTHLHHDDETSHDNFPLVDPNEENEVRPSVKSMKAIVHTNLSLGSNRFDKFSSWRRLVEAIAFLRRKVCLLKQGPSDAHRSKSVEGFKEAECLIIKIVQHEQF